MFKKQQLKKAQRLLNLKEKESVRKFAKRLRGWIKNIQKIDNKDITDDAILRGINLILSDLQKIEIEEAKNIKKINLDKVKNPILKEFGNKIMELYTQGLSPRKISNFLEEKEGKKISYGTIYNFIKQSNEKGK